MTGSMERAIAETNRRREKQIAYNTAQRHHAGEHQAQHPRRHVSRSTSRITSPSTPASPDDDAPLVGHNLAKVIADMEQRMNDAAADLEFETAARLRDEIKRLRETELAIADDPLARQTDVEDKAGGYKGDAQVRRSPIRARRPAPRAGSCRAHQKSKPNTSRCSRPTRSRRRRPARSRIKKPSLDDMGPGTDRAVPRRDPAACRRARRTSIRAPRPVRSAKACAGPHKPTLDEMGPHAMLPVKGAPRRVRCAPSTYRPSPRRKAAAAAPARPAGRGSDHG